MEYQVIRADKSKDYLKNVIWTPTDITENVVMPIIDVSRYDRALDTSAVTYIDNKPTATKPFSKMIIRAGSENIYRRILHDNVQIITNGNKREYKHTLDLIEPTKELERFVVDNTTITNLLAFLYEDNVLVDAQVLQGTNTSFTHENDLGKPVISSAEYIGAGRYYDRYIQRTTLDNVDYRPTVKFKFFGEGIVVTKFQELDLISKKIIDPNGNEMTLTDDYQLAESGQYKIVHQYSKEHVKVSSSGSGTQIKYNSFYATYEWTILSIKRTELDKHPTRYTIKRVVEEILSKVATETSAPRLNLDSPLFHLDPRQADRLDKIYSPEFTFTQNTLFGVLEEIGNYIHAIPRLQPTTRQITTNDGLVTDDWSNWDEITFDFIGENNKTYVIGNTEFIEDEISIEDAYDIINSEQAYNGENYATSFVTNVQNSFQTNKEDYISLVEPYEGGYVSARTEDGNFEISNENAVIKTSRPIQRIVSLEVGVQLKNNEGNQEFFDLDITQRVKEATDYNLLIDYASLGTDILKTKSSAIYYTRGNNVINGLTYYPPKRLNIEYLATNRAIQNIIYLVGRTQEPVKLKTLTYEQVKSLRIKDLMFRIKYIPYYNFRANQYKQSVNESSGNNTLFYNQQNAQQVDIESLGENVRGALMMTANKELSMTGYINRNEMKAGDILHTIGIYGNESNYYAYQINREFIDNNNVKSTITFSKNFNKWNDYIAIKKNYREWEISNRESVETNPITNQFCIISNRSDFEELSNNEIRTLSDDIDRNKGFAIKSFMEGLFNSLGSEVFDKDIRALRWVLIKTKAYNEVTTETEERTLFLPCACFGYGNSMVLNFATQDNYSAGTKAEHGADTTPDLPIGGYDLENYVEYGNTLGKVDTMEVAFGYGELKKDGFIDYSSAKTSSKEFYDIEDTTEINEQNVAVDYRGENPFIIKKDSRQQLNFTAQLNFVSDTQNILISPNLVNKLVFVGAKRKKKSVKWVWLRKSPDIFIDKLNTEDIIKTSEIEMIIEANNNNTAFIIPTDDVDPEQFEGIALVDCNNATNTIDNNSKILVYYKKDEKYATRIFIKLRSKI